MTYAYQEAPQDCVICCVSLCFNESNDAITSLTIIFVIHDQLVVFLKTSKQYFHQSQVLRGTYIYQDDLISFRCFQTNGDRSSSTSFVTTIIWRYDLIFRSHPNIAKHFQLLALCIWTCFLKTVQKALRNKVVNKTKSIWYCSLLICSHYKFKLAS